MSISSVIPFLTERVVFLFLMTVGFCSNIYLVNMYDLVVLNETSRIRVKLLYFDGCKCSFLWHRQSAHAV